MHRLRPGKKKYNHIKLPKVCVFIVFVYVINKCNLINAWLTVYIFDIFINEHLPWCAVLRTFSPRLLADYLWISKNEVLCFQFLTVRISIHTHLMHIQHTFYFHSILISLHHHLFFCNRRFIVRAFSLKMHSTFLRNASRFHQTNSLFMQLKKQCGKWRRASIYAISVFIIVIKRAVCWMCVFVCLLKNKE